MVRYFGIYDGDTLAAMAGERIALMAIRRSALSARIPTTPGRPCQRLVAAFDQR